MKSQVSIQIYDESIILFLLLKQIKITKKTPFIVCLDFDHLFQI